MADSELKSTRGWPRKKVAWFGLALLVPFFAIAVLIKIFSAFSSNPTPVYVLLVLSAFFVFVSGAGLIILLVAWFTPKGQRPFVDPIKLW